ALGDRGGDLDVDREGLVGAGGEAARVRAGDRLAAGQAARGGAAGLEAGAGRQRVGRVEATRVVGGAAVVDGQRVVEARGRAGDGVGRSALGDRQVGERVHGRRGRPGVFVGAVRTAGAVALSLPDALPICALGDRGGDLDVDREGLV